MIDGAIRDLDVIIGEDYGLTVYATQRSFHGSVDATPADENGQIQCGGALVRPGDVMVGDNDGVLVVPSWMAEAVLKWAIEHEEHEDGAAVVRGREDAVGVGHCRRHGLLRRTCLPAARAVTA